jgi:hypothetical protein
MNFFTGRIMATNSPTDNRQIVADDATTLPRRTMTPASLRWHVWCKP